jgi:hypothetical protein
MNSSLTIKIPEEIAGLPNLSLAEAVALSHILEHPGCTNRTLAKLVRQTERGVESMLCRLRERGLIRPEGSGRRRRIFLGFHVEHKKCGESLNSQLHVQCEVPDIIIPAKHDSACLNSALSRLEIFANCIDAGKFDAALVHISSIREAVQGDFAVPDLEKDKLLALIKVEEDRCFAFALGAKVAERLTSTDQVRLACALSTAPVEKLTTLRQKIETQDLKISDQVPLLVEVIEKEFLT